MQWDVPVGAAAVHAPVLQLVVTAGATALLAALWVRFGKAHFLFWTLAWALYAVRIAVILTFLVTERPIWLFWHQVATGWTAVAFLWAVLVFATGRGARTWAAVIGIAFPLLWSYFAVFRLDNFMLAVVPAVAFLSGATLWTALVFWQHGRRTRSAAASMLAFGFALWGLHHLDYPFLRAQGIWNPWGYYLDILFELWTVAGLLLLVQDDLRVGLQSLIGLSADVQGAPAGGEAQRVLLDRPLGLPGVVGAALYERADGFTAGAGACAGWRISGPPEGVAELARSALESGGYESGDESGSLPSMRADPEARHVGVLPLGAQPSAAALVLVSNARDPFTALDDRYLEAFGQQLGTALDQAELRDQLADRGRLLERLTKRLAHQHEEERARLSRELHDETAQVLAALSLELGSLAESLDAERAEQAEVALRLVREGIASIRSVTDRLRPPLLDDLGLVPALTALVDAYRRDAGLDVTFEAPDQGVPMSAERELTLYRALQEGLANVARHSGSRTARVRVDLAPGEAALWVADDGVGVPEPDGVWGSPGLGGLRERVLRLGGAVSLRQGDGGGTELEVRFPLAATDLIEAEVAT